MEGSNSRGLFVQPRNMTEAGPSCLRPALDAGVRGEPQAQRPIAKPKTVIAGRMALILCIPPQLTIVKWTGAGVRCQDKSGLGSLGFDMSRFDYASSELMDGVAGCCRASWSSEKATGHFPGRVFGGRGGHTGCGGLASGAGAGLQGEMVDGVVDNLR